MRNLATLESDTQATIARVRADIAAIRERAGDAGRAETAEERAQIETLLRDATTAKAALDRRRSDDAMGEAIAQLGTGAPPPGGGAMVLRPTMTLATSRRVESIGTQFVHSAAYQYIRDTRGSRPQHWQTPSAELFDAVLHAATLTEDPASGGDLVIPDVRSGVQPLLFRRLVVADLIAPGTTDSSTVSYMVEKTYVNAADTVLEGAAKPESTITFDAVSDPVRKIAHWLPVTEEMLEDVSFIRSYLNARLITGVQLSEEDQLLNGTAVAPDIIGIRNRAGLAPAIPKGADSIADAIWKQISAIANTAMVTPDGIVMNPLDWSTIPMMKNTAGDYVEGGGPFQRPGAAVLWGLPVAVTPAMPVGVALVGAFRTAAQVFRKGGIRVEISNSHQDFFVRNLVAIRAEERLALAVYRPGAFGEVTGLDAP